MQNPPPLERFIKNYVMLNVKKRVFVGGSRFSKFCVLPVQDTVFVVVEANVDTFVRPLQTQFLQRKTPQA